MAAADRPFRGGGTATTLCVYRNNIQPPLESWAHAHNTIDTAAAAATAATAATGHCCDVTEPIAVVCIQGSPCSPTLDLLFMIIIYNYILYVQCGDSDFRMYIITDPVIINKYVLYFYISMLVSMPARLRNSAEVLCRI